MFHSPTRIAQSQVEPQAITRDENHLQGLAFACGAPEDIALLTSLYANGKGRELVLPPASPSIDHLGATKRHWKVKFWWWRGYVLGRDGLRIAAPLFTKASQCFTSTWTRSTHSPYRYKIIGFHIHVYFSFLTDIYIYIFFSVLKFCQKVAEHSNLVWKKV